MTEAFAMGFKVIPSTRLGTLRPPELQDAANRIELTEEHHRDIWALLLRIDDVCTAIEERGVGMSPLLAIGRRIQDRLRMTDAAWYDGLNQASDEAEKREIADAFSEWADGDSVALHVGYELDVFCTHDRAKPGRPSVFNTENRDWLAQAFGVRFMTLGELARTIRA